jgi:DNA-binding LacI/PurR family transcriptional regulator
LREQVKAAAERLGYDGPDPKGKLLSSGKVNAIGVVPTAAFGISLFFEDPYNREFLAGIAEVCEEHGCGLSLVSAADDEQLWGIRTAIVDGFIFNSIEQAELIEPAKRRRLPFVVMDFDGGPEVSSVRIDDRDGARQLAQHLIALGHRRIAVAAPLRSLHAPIFHPPGRNRPLLADATQPQRERLAGVCEAFEAAGISIDASPVLESCTSVAEAAKFGDGVATLLGRLEDATAVLAFTDKIALSVLKQARNRGFSVPSDLSVVGFDDNPESAITEPPLTTVAQPTREKGRAAAQMLLQGGPPRHVILPIELVIRASSAPPRHQEDDGQL